MHIALTSFVFLIAALCAGVMGFAIQRGATCTVAAVDEVVGKHSRRRLLSLLEASLWVAGGLVLAQAFHLLPHMPAGYATSGWTVLGGALLGLGAWVNGACVFGAIARLGSGQWAYVLTPVGFYLGCLSVGAVFSMPAPARLAHGSPVLQAPSWLGLLFVGFVAWRIGRGWRGTAQGTARPSTAARLRELIGARIWSPHAATTVIGVTFLAMLLLVGTWAYTDVLAELARGMSANLVARCLLLLALLLGAAWGGWTAGRWRSARITATDVLRCLAGGMLMGWGSLLIPGSNDGLILVGMPLLWPYAWLAFGTMCATIGAAQLLRRTLEGTRQATGTP